MSGNSKKERGAREEGLGDVAEFGQRIAKCRERFEELLAEVIKPRRKTLDAVERTRFAGLQDVGRAMLEALVAVEAAKDQASEVADARGQKLPYQSYKSVRYRSLFGPIGPSRWSGPATGRKGAVEAHAWVER